MMLTQHLAQSLPCRWFIICSILESKAIRQIADIYKLKIVPISSLRQQLI